jgi:hypothetical protein
MDDLVSSILVDLNNDKVGCPHFSAGLMDGEVLIRKERKWDLIGFFIHFHFIKGIASADAD